MCYHLGTCPHHSFVSLSEPFSRAVRVAEGAEDWANLEQMSHYSRHSFLFRCDRATGLKYDTIKVCVYLMRL